MTPTRRKADKSTKPEKSIGATGALSSNDVQVPVDVAPASTKGAGEMSGTAKNAAETNGAAKRGTAETNDAAKRPSVKANEGLKKLRIALTVSVLLLVVGAGAFAGYRWLYGNDALNIQGVWYVNGSDATITITEGEIILSEEVSYTYTLDHVDKSIEFFFNDLSGCGHYRFSLDRGEVAIIDGECSGFDSVRSDFSWLLHALLFAIQGKEAAPAEGDQAMLLSREPVVIVGEPAEGEAVGESGEGEAAEGEGEPAGGSAPADGEPATDAAQPAEGEPTPNPAEPIPPASADTSGSSSSDNEFTLDVSEKTE